LGLILALFQNGVNGQARVQLIHNSADTSHRFFDVWIGNTKVYNNLEFRTATAFVDVPVTSQISILLTDSASTGPEDPIYIYRRTYENGHKYLLVINGVDSLGGYNPFKELSITAFDNGREVASNASKTDILFLNGSTDAPVVDVLDETLGLISNNLAYNDFDGYFGFLPNDYFLYIKDDNTQSTLYSYQLPLLSLGLQGQAGVVLMSGFVDPSVNSFGESFGLFLALPAGGALIPLPSYTEPKAPLQFIHNSPNSQADSLDIWIDGKLAFNNLKFRNASAYVDQPAGRIIQIAVCAPNSLSPSSPIISSDVILTENEPIQVILSGMTQTAGYTPPTPAALHLYSPARIGSAVTGNTDLLFYNGSTDFGPVTLAETTTTIGTLTENLPYGVSDGYKEVLTANYAFEVRNSSNEVVGTYDVPLSGYLMNNQSTTVMTSGFLDKVANNNGPAFGIFLVPQKGGALITLLPYTPPTFAEFQVINNSADLVCDTLDIWVDGEKVIPDLRFRTSSRFLQVTAGSEVTIAVKPKGSASAENPMISGVFTPEAGKKYAFLIHGIYSASGYNPIQPFDLTMIEGVRENASSGGMVDVMIIHQSTDAASPADFIESGGVWLLGMTYGQHSGYMQKPVADYSIGFRPADSANPYKFYGLPVNEMGLSGKTVMILTSGFFNPAVNSNGEAFGLWAVVPGGGKLVELSDVTGIEDHTPETSFSVYPNPAVDVVTLVSKQQLNANAIVQVMNLTGQVMLRTMVSVVNGVANLQVSSLPSGSYLISMAVDGGTCIARLQVIR